MVQVGVTSSTGGSIKRSACSQDLQPPSPQQKGQKGTVSSKDATNLYAMMSPPQSKSAPDSNESPETLMATSEEAATNCELRKVFIEFARFGTRSQTKHMDIFRFMKMCRECGLLLRQQDVSSIDLIFYKVCLPGPPLWRIPGMHDHPRHVAQLSHRRMLLRSPTPPHTMLCYLYAMCMVVQRHSWMSSLASASRARPSR